MILFYQIINCVQQIWISFGTLWITLDHLWITLDRSRPFPSPQRHHKILILPKLRLPQSQLHKSVYQESKKLPGAKVRDSIFHLKQPPFIFIFLKSSNIRRSFLFPDDIQSLYRVLLFQSLQQVRAHEPVDSRYQYLHCIIKDLTLSQPTEGRILINQKNGYYYY